MYLFQPTMCAPCLRANYICTAQRPASVTFPFETPPWHNGVEENITRFGENEARNCDLLVFVIKKFTSISTLKRNPRFICHGCFLACLVRTHTRALTCAHTCREDHVSYRGAERDDEREAQLTSSVVTHTCSRMHLHSNKTCNCAELIFEVVIFNAHFYLPFLLQYFVEMHFSVGFLPDLLS